MTKHTPEQKCIITTNITHNFTQYIKYNIHTSTKHCTSQNILHYTLHSIVCALSQLSRCLLSMVYLPNTCPALSTVCYWSRSILQWKSHLLVSQIFISQKLCCFLIDRHVYTVYHPATYKLHHFTINFMLTLGL